MENCNQIRFFEIPYNDMKENAVRMEVVDGIAVDNGFSMLDNLRRRDLESRWMTTGSNDDAHTTITCYVPNADHISHIFLVENNFKDLDVQVLSRAEWSTVKEVRNNTDRNLEIDLDTRAEAVRLVIYGTMIPNEDKELTRFIITDQIHQLIGYPTIRNLKHEFGTKVVKMLSGKSRLFERGHSIRFMLKVKVETNQGDFDFYERLFFLLKYGVMVQLSGGNENQFLLKATGYRNQDFYVVRPSESLKSEFYEGLYFSGQPIEIPFVEVV